MIKRILGLILVPVVVIATMFQIIYLVFRWVFTGKSILDCRPLLIDYIESL